MTFERAVQHEFEVRGALLGGDKNLTCDSWPFGYHGFRFFHLVSEQGEIRPDARGIDFHSSRRLAPPYVGL